MLRRSGRKHSQIKPTSDEGCKYEFSAEEIRNVYIHDLPSSDSEDNIRDERKTPKVLHEDGDKCGSELFTFKASKTKTSVMDSAFKNLKLNEQTPKSLKRNRSKNVNHSTPRRSGSIKKIAPPEAETPYNLRRKLKHKIAKLTTQEEQASETESSENEGSDSNDSNEESDTLNFDHLKINKDERNFMAENYFRAHSEKTATSNHTLTRLGTPRLDHESLQRALSTLLPSHSLQVEELFKDKRSLFGKWTFQLSEGFNLLLYGFGSKRRLLLDFRENYLSDENSLVINGFFTNITIKTILTSIIEEIYDKRASNNPQDMLNTIKSIIANERENLYIIIHNIDGTMLRSEKVQSIICKLAEIDKIRILASIDHINAPLIWDQNKLSRLNWVWHDVTTFLPYTDETTFEHNLLIKPSDNIVLSSLIFVFRSLNPKAKKIFLLLASYQLDNMDNPAYIGMAYQDCYCKCRENFLVNSDLTLKTQLTEFKDHKIIKFKKGPDGVEYLQIPLEANVLANFVEQNKQ